MLGKSTIEPTISDTSGSWQRLDGESPSGLHDIAPEDLAMAPVLREADRIILLRYPPAGVIVDASLRIIEIRGDAAALLVQPPRSGDRLLDRARPELVDELKAAFDRARHLDMAVRVGPLQSRHDGGAMEVFLEVVPFRADTAEARDPHFLVLLDKQRAAILDEPEDEDESGPRSPSPQPASADPRLVLKLRRDLMTTKEQMQLIIEELQATNEELQSSNEELMASNEEIHDTLEELDRTRRELQAANERLSAANAELARKNAALTRRDGKVDGDGPDAPDPRGQ